MACLSFSVQKVVASTRRVVVPSSVVAWRRAVAPAACFSSLSGRSGGAGGGVSSSSSRPLLGDHNRVQEFPLPLSSYPVLMLWPSTGTTCHVFNPITREFTKITYPAGAGRKLCRSTSMPYSNHHGWVSFFPRNDCSLILANGVLSNENPSTIFLPPFHTLPNLHSLPIDAADPQLKAMASPGTDFFFHYTDALYGREVKLLPSGLVCEVYSGNFVLSSAPTEDNCVALLTPTPRLREDLGIDFAYCRTGDTRWSTVPLPPHDKRGYESRIQDVVYSRRDKVFYVLTSRKDSRIQVIDFNDPDSPPKRLCSAHQTFPQGPYQEEDVIQYNFLAESAQGDPLLVFQYNDPSGDRTLGFHAHKLSFNQEKLVAEEFNFDDTALFVAGGERYASFTVPVCDYPGLMPNTVYYFGDGEIGYYNLMDQAFTHFYQRFEMPMSYIAGDPMWVSRPQ